MDNINNSRLLPTLDMLADALRERGWEVTVSEGAERAYRGVRRYEGQDPSPEYLYLVSPNDGFPRDEYACVSAVNFLGKAENMVCPGKSETDILHTLFDIFEEFREISDAINALSYRDASLQELCELGEELLGNPTVIHDDWFAVLAQSKGMGALLPPRGPNESARFLPNQWLEEFKFDDDYRETYGHSRARLWVQDSMQGNNQSIYVNLLHQNRYLGRLLMLGSNHAPRHRDYPILELLMRQALVILRGQGGTAHSRGMDMIVMDLIQGKPLSYSDESAFLGMLHWKADDPLLCIRMKNQQTDDTGVVEHALHADLFDAFPRSYILYRETQQCIILNLNVYEFSVPSLRHALSPLCRDYLHYAGISSPVGGIRELGIAYTQAGIALQRTFDKRDAVWVNVFCDCAMDYLLTQLMPPTRLRHLISPHLMRLIEWDEKEGTQLFDTLRTYLVMERDIPKTSRMLIVHRTTLLYRLKKINAIIGLDLEDHEVRLYLLLSLKMMEKENLIPPMKTELPPE